MVSERMRGQARIGKWQEQQGENEKEKMTEKKGDLVSDSRFSL